MGNRRQELFAVGTHHFCRNRSGRHFYQHHMVKPDPIERILKRQYTLYFMSTDHGIEDIFHGQRLPTLCRPLLR